MRINLLISDALMREAMQATGLKTHKAVVEAGLQLLIQTQAQGRVRRLRGKLHWEGNLDLSRAGALEHDPRFLQRIEHARQSLRAGQGIKLEDLEI